MNRGDTQFVLMDTPGFHKPRTKLGDYMVSVVEESVSDVDLALLLVEPIANIGPQEEALIARFEQSGVPAFLGYLGGVMATFSIFTSDLW